jgi:AraC-like DNA-binding protein
MSKDKCFFCYLPISDETILRGFYVTSAGCQHTAPGEQFPPKQHPLIYHFNWDRGRTLPEFALVLFTKGQGEFESTQAGKQTISPNALTLITPGQWHRYRPTPKTGFTERWICFNGEIPHDFLDRGLLGPVDTILPVRDPESFIARFNRLLKFVHEHHSINPVTVTHHAVALLGEALVATRQDQSVDQELRTSTRMARSDPLIAKALDLIWTQSHGPLAVKDIVSHLPTTRRTLERHFESVLGHSILDEINICRISRAKRLLSETNLTMKRVAFLSGFAGADRMRLAFLKYTNLNPTHYRRNQLGVKELWDSGGLKD